MSMNLGDIYQSALRSVREGAETADEIRAAIHKDQVNNAAYFAANFLRNLPEDVDVMGLLKLIDDFVGGEMGSEILRRLMGVNISNYGYRVVIIPSYPARPNKINGIREIRDVIGSGLREAKDFIEGTTNMNMSIEQSQELKKRLQPEGFDIIPLR